MLNEFSAKFNAIKDARPKSSFILLRPQLVTMPLPMLKYDEPFFPFGKQVIDATQDYVCGYVFDLASYMRLGAAGIIALERTIHYVDDNLLTILHGPFSGEDFASICDATAFDVDAITTISGYPNAVSNAVVLEAHHGNSRDYLHITWKDNGQAYRCDVIPQSLILLSRQEDFAEQVRDSVIRQQHLLSDLNLPNDVLSSVICECFHAGLIQVGTFMRDDTPVPFQIDFEMLPAYPNLLNSIADLLIQKMDYRDTERIIASPTSVAVGTVISQKTGVPLVYTRKSGQLTAADIVGAYDIGHPSILVLNEMPADTATLQQNIEVLQRVGLEVRSIITLASTNKTNTERSSIEMMPLFKLEYAATTLENAKLIPAQQAATIRDYMRTQ